MPRIDSSETLEALLNTRLKAIRQNKNFAIRFSRMKVLVEKDIAERTSSSYVPEEKLQAAITR